MKRKNPTLAFAELEDMEFSEIEYLPEDDDERALLASAEGDESVGPTSPATDPAADSTSTATPSPASD